MDEGAEPLDRTDRSARMLEVDFALVVSRLIEAAQHDPEQLRGAIYELARLKLVGQADGVDDQERRRIVDALEIAIQGVEKFSQKRSSSLLGPVASDSRDLAMVNNRPSAVIAREDVVADRLKGEFTPPVRAYVNPDDISPSVVHVRVSSPRRRVPAIAGGIALLLLMLVMVVAWPRLGLRLPTSDLASPPLAAGPPQDGRSSTVAARWPEQVAAGQDTRSPLVPRTFGVFAISADQLFELQALPGRVPDARVAISAAINSPSLTSVPDGKVRFIVYRRDGPGGTPDRADIRVVAKVTSAMSFGSGKPTVTTTEDAWVIRNISFNYRVAPIREEPDMYEIRGDEAAALSPGRYALVIKGVAYDFSVAGSVSDPMQCLERVEAANGSFYSPCQKPR